MFRVFAGSLVTTWSWDQQHLENRHFSLLPDSWLTRFVAKHVPYWNGICCLREQNHFSSVWNPAALMYCLRAKTTLSYHNVPECRTFLEGQWKPAQPQLSQDGLHGLAWCNILKGQLWFCNLPPVAKKQSMWTCFVLLLFGILLDFLVHFFHCIFLESENVFLSVVVTLIVCAFQRRTFIATLYYNLLSCRVILKLLKLLAFFI